MSTWTSITTSPVPTRRLGGLAIDGIVICAIGTLSLSALGENIGPLLILAVASVAWSIVLVLVIGRRVFAREWFERSIAESSAKADAEAALEVTSERWETIA